jgi:hypothetical protein
MLQSHAYHDDQYYPIRHAVIFTNMAYQHLCNDSYLDLFELKLFLEDHTNY